MKKEVLHRVRQIDAKILKLAQAATRLQDADRLDIFEPAEDGEGSQRSEAIKFPPRARYVYNDERQDFDRLLATFDEVIEEIQISENPEERKEAAIEAATFINLRLERIRGELLKLEEELEKL